MKSYLSDKWNRRIFAPHEKCYVMNSSYPSTLLENAVNEFARLPGIGRKSALRLVLHLLRQDEQKDDPDITITLAAFNLMFTHFPTIMQDL